jgi:hypothetical protein
VQLVSSKLVILFVEHRSVDSLFDSFEPGIESRLLQITNLFNSHLFRCSYGMWLSLVGNLRRQLSLAELAAKLFI